MKVVQWHYLFIVLTNLASLLEDKEVLTREQKIAIARQQMQQSVN